MNSTMLTGAALTVLGLGGVVATGAATAVIPAVFGLILLGLGLSSLERRSTGKQNTA